MCPFLGLPLHASAQIDKVFSAKCDFVGVIYRFSMQSIRTEQRLLYFHIIIFFLIFLLKSLGIENLFVYLQTVSGRNPKLQMHKLIISHLPKQPRKLLLEQFDLRKQREKPKKGYSLTSFQLCTRLWRGAFLIRCQGFQFLGSPLR